jgi:predicted Zn-dependent peptidase
VVPVAARSRDERVELSRLTQVYFAYARDSLAAVVADRPAAMIADHVLGGHFNSRLMAALRLAGGETYDASVLDTGDVEPGVYALETFSRTENAAPTEAKLREVLETFHRDGITEGERAAAAGYALGRLAFGRQSPDQLLRRTMRERRMGLPVGSFEELARKAAALPLEEVNRFIRRFHDPAAFTMVRVEAR